MLDVVRQSLTHQFDAALCMLNDCIEKCPDAHWGGNVAKYPFWQVGYPGVMATDTAPFRYPHYHTAQDTPDNVNYDRTARVVAGIARVVEALADHD